MSSDAVSVITGGAGGMGAATAALVGRDHTVVLFDIRAQRLATAKATLEKSGIAVTAVAGDVTDPRAVADVLAQAADLGSLRSVIHTAGVSPSMGEAEFIVRTNALGTVTVGEEFFRVAPAGAALVNVASMAAHLLPDTLYPTAAYPKALEDPEAFTAEALSACGIGPDEARPGLAYAISKSFVRWYSTAQAERFNGRGLRVLSVSPGSTDTDMGRLEEQAGAGALVVDAAVPRWGTAEEMGELLAFCASSRVGYLTGTDILCDGGVVASVSERARRAGGG
ncbi:SDR family oxidoreductase [Mycolicibacterium sp. 018/SC-01/001]|uniref:SDR family oxidoreductase n=1 Tax=Mycolicibacterium sp. 018/SC-01/001 TaxID=2592069 RepID=UPI00117DB14E|nr:SDR family oxidoreductase [Mycolicibacterium sp. 018/SC-01/001]TRW89043.1 SDR family oxidoreductase [Mycolicibacterium sp. 018/SC-01/001]